MPKMTLGEAVNQNCMRVVREYIESSADPNVSADGLVPLREACFNENIPMMKYLLTHGADPNARDENGHNALFYVIAGMRHEDRIARFELLYRYGIDLHARDKRGDTILQYISHDGYNNNAIARWLRRHGVKE